MKTMKTKKKTTSSSLDFEPIEKTSKKVTGGKVPKLPVLNRVIRNMSSAAYHGAIGTWSSSQLKVILESEQLFVRKYILRTQANEGSESFDTGNYFHTKVLEPHKLGADVAIFRGKIRSGKDWELFKKKSAGKVLVTAKQASEGDGLAEAVNRSPISMKYLKGESEISLFIEVIVDGGKIYAPHFGKVLGTNGWETTSRLPSKSGYKMVLKVRADKLGDTFISDLKSTSGNALSDYSIRQSISKYQYDLSAAFYLDLFSLVLEDVEKFIWIFASKDIYVAKSWIASKDNILVGRAKWSKAVVKIADLARAKWEVVDSLGVAEPMPWERVEWIKSRDIDLL